MGDEVIGDVSAHIYSAALQTPANEAFVKKYRAKYGKEPTTFIAHPADALSLIAAAVKASGGEVDRVKLAEAMRNGISFAGGNGMFNFTDANHNGLDENSKSMIMLQVKGGKFVLAD